MKFFLKTKKTEGKGNLFFEVCKRTPKIKVQICTNVSVSIQAWQTANESAKNLTKYMNTPEGAKVMSLLNQIESAVNNLFSLGVIHGSEDKSIIEGEVNRIAFADERARQAEEQAEEERKRAEEKQKYKNIMVFCSSYVQDINEGKVRSTRGKQFSENDKRGWRTFANVLGSFMERRTERTFAEITPSFANGFSMFLINNGYMVSTQAQYIGRFRNLCKLSAKYGYNNNAISLQVWNSPTATKEDKQTAIYLTDEELNELYKMPLLGNRAEVRDIFFIGSIIAQRWSDYSRIEKSMFQAVNGVLFLTLTQKKTGKEVVIPITDERVIKTLGKYDYTLPRFSQMMMNYTIKDIFCELSEHLESLREEFETKATLAERNCTKENYKYKERITPEGIIIKEKWELISTHTARRSGVTNMYKSGALDKHEMMSITGHSTERIFENYIKLGAMEQAKRIADKLKASTGKDHQTQNKTV